MPDGLLALVALGLALGLRHGIDWDHIAAIADLTAGSGARRQESGVGGRGPAPPAPRPWPLASSAGWERFALAMLYGLGHASVVLLLGLLAIWLGSLLPEWLDPVLERVVGLTLVGLGLWVFYSLWRDGASFRLQSRWMLLLSVASRAWAWARSRLLGRPVEHHPRLDGYTPKAAFAIGMVHAFGAETGSQTVLLATAAGATTLAAGSLLLLSFVAGLLLSNSLVAALSTVGFVSSQARRGVYLGIGIIAGAFSLVMGTFFLLGQGTALPDLFPRNP